MTHIRPHQLFQMVQAPIADRVAKLIIPAHQAAGGTTLLESVLLIAALRIVQAKRVFEFGTFRGTNTLNLALNIPDDGMVYTLDLDDTCNVQHSADLEYARTHLSSTMDFEGTPQEKRIRRLSGNSRAFDYSQWHRSMDLCFIDGGHDIGTLSEDTPAAFDMRSERSCIVWHDYGNPEYQELTDYLDVLSHMQPIVHVEDTTLCFCFTTFPPA